MTDDPKPTDDEERKPTPEELEDAWLEVDRQASRMFSGVPVAAAIQALSKDDLLHIVKLSRESLTKRSIPLSFWFQSMCTAELASGRFNPEPDAPPRREVESPELPTPRWDNSTLCDALIACHVFNFAIRDVSENAGRFLDAVELSLLVAASHRLKNLPGEEGSHADG